MLVRVYTCQNVKLLEISCRGSLLLIKMPIIKGILIKHGLLTSFSLIVYRVTKIQLDAQQ